MRTARRAGARRRLLEQKHHHEPEPDRRQPLVGAAVTAHAHDALAQQPTREELFELALDEARVPESVLGPIARLIDLGPVEPDDSCQS
jgi:hypothetical protein